MPQILRDQAEDRDDPLKVAALKRLASDFVRLGEEIATMDSIPPPAAGIHAQLSAAYKDAGAKLSLIADAKSDEAFLLAVNTYNTSSETLTKRLIGLVELFQARSVTFSSTDSGGIFTFSANSSF